MGQYHKLYNLDKKEFVHAHDLGLGLKLMEQCGFEGSTADALFLLLANSNGRGGGDAPDHDYIGRWAGDRILVQGDYAEHLDTGYVDQTELDEYNNISAMVAEMLANTF